MDRTLTLILLGIGAYYLYTRDNSRLQYPQIYPANYVGPLPPGATYARPGQIPTVGVTIGPSGAPSTGPTGGPGGTTPVYNTSPTLTCWDGVVVSDLSLCPPVNQTQDNWLQCPDGANYVTDLSDCPPA